MPPNIGHTPIIGFPISGGNICYIPPYFGEIKFILPPNIATPPIWWGALGGADGDMNIGG